MARLSFCLTLLLAPVDLIVAASTFTKSAVSLRGLHAHDSTRAASAQDPLETPNLTGYEPEEVLCSRKDKIQGWCTDWIMCIKKEASPAGDAAAVMTAWDPAECEQMCGVWPVTNPPEGQNTSAMLQVSKLNVSMTATSNLFRLQKKSSKSDCMKSCQNFKESLSSCVATIVFEPGKVAAMGMESATANTRAPAEICTRKNSPCKPTLEVEHQKCILLKSKHTLGVKVEDEVFSRCKRLAMDFTDCKDAKCPSMEGAALSEYNAFTGGCMDQLNAYHAATDPAAGKAALPGASGKCTVH